jgi:hypothetical protein
MSRPPHFLDNRLTDGGEVVSHTSQPPCTPYEDSCYSFARSWVDPRAIMRIKWHDSHMESRDNWFRHSSDFNGII